MFWRMRILMLRSVYYQQHYDNAQWQVKTMTVMVYSKSVVYTCGSICLENLCPLQPCIQFNGISCVLVI